MRILLTFFGITNFSLFFCKQRFSHPTQVCNLVDNVFSSRSFTCSNFGCYFIFLQIFDVHLLLSRRIPLDLGRVIPSVTIHVLYTCFPLDHEHQLLSMCFSLDHEHVHHVFSLDIRCVLPTVTHVIPVTTVTTIIDVFQIMSRLSMFTSYCCVDLGRVLPTCFPLDHGHLHYTRIHFFLLDLNPRVIHVFSSMCAIY